jgi:hypothetical protein
MNTAMPARMKLKRIRRAGGDPSTESNLELGVGEEEEVMEVGMREGGGRLKSVEVKRHGKKRGAHAPVAPVICFLCDG